VAEDWGTKPESPEEAENQKAFAANPAVLMEMPNGGFRN